MLLSLTTNIEALWRGIIKAKSQVASESLAGRRAGSTYFVFPTLENVRAKRTSKVVSIPEDRLSLLKSKF